jgi:hypothetical protein
MPTYSALTVRKLKPGTYDDWRKAWGGSHEEMPRVSGPTSSGT